MVWEGGDNFYKRKKWNNGKMNSGDQKKKYGAAGTKRGRFNPNPTKCNHVSCLILQRAKQEKAAYLKNSSRPVKVFRSKVKSTFAV